MKIDKIVLTIAIIFIFSGIVLSSNVGGSGGWVFQSGLVFLFGALTLFLAEKYSEFEMVSFGLMVLLTIWFLVGTWNLHPLGSIISITGCIWVAYGMSKNKKLTNK